MDAGSPVVNSADLIEKLPDPLVTIDGGWRITYVNEMAETALGAPRLELVGTILWDSCPWMLGSCFESSLRRAMEARTDVSLEGWDPESDLWRRLRGFPVEGGLAFSLQEVSERSKREEAERANEAKTEFLSRMSHELRTPLTAILGFSQLLEMEPLEAGQRESVEQIRRGGNQLLALINEVLDITRIETGCLPISPEPVDVGEVLDQALSLVAPLAVSRGIRLHRPKTGPDPWVRADRQRLNQVILNLLSNAIKYNRAEGLVEVDWTERPGNRIRLAVRDTGPGIPAERRARLFQPFERLGAEQTTVEGTGLGLALSKTLVEMMGGGIGMDSSGADGCVFWVELPADESPVERYERSEYVPEAPHPSRPADRHSVLCIDDNVSNVKLIQRVLERRPGVEVLTALQGSTGVELAAQHNPSLILLDLNLPDLSGEQILLRLRGAAATREIPVVVVSADATSGQVRRLKDAGVHEYLAKPLDIGRFLAVLDGILEGRETYV